MGSVFTVEHALRWMRLFRIAVDTASPHLTELDLAIGDGDHGLNMVRGLAAVDAALAGNEPGSGGLGLGEVFRTVGMTLVSTVGGATGPLYGTMFLRMAAGLDGLAAVDLTGLTDALARGLEGLRARGKALPGDKTLVDSLTPAVEALRGASDAGLDLEAALAAASAAARAGRDATAPLLARQGRASYLGERSIGHRDPGASSMALLIEAAEAALGA